jgi:hypothetical protein
MKILTNFIFNKFFLFILSIIVLAPPLNSWLKIFLLSVALVIIFFSEIKSINNKNYFIFFFIILLFVPKVFLNKYQILVNHIILPVVDQKGLNYVENILPQGMHEILNQELSDLRKKEKLFNKISQPGRYKRDTLYKKFAFQSETLWTTVDEGKYLNISDNLTYWDLGPSALNDVKLNFGDTEKEKYDTNLIFPVLFKINLPNTKLNEVCFRGILIYGNDTNYKIEKNSQRKCIKNFKYSDLYLFDIDRKTLLDINNNFYLDNIYILIYIITLIQLFLIFYNFIKINKFYLFTIFSFYIVLFLYFKFGFQPISAFSENIYLDRGMDGIVHFGFGRIILNDIFLGNYLDAFRGSENIFYFMPLLRYINASLMLIFGDNLLGSIFIISFFGILINKVLNIIISIKASKILTIFFFYLPIFESLGFTIINYISFTVDGYAEGISYFLLICVVYLYLQKDMKNSYFFLMGFFSFLIIGLRPNYFVLLFSLFFTYSIYLILDTKQIRSNISKLSFLLLGVIPVFLIPFHNYYFSNQLVLMTDEVNALYHITVNDYLVYFNFFSQNNIDPTSTKAILNHLTHYIKIYEVWFMIILANLFVVLFLNFPFKIKILTSACILMHLTFLFFLGDPRYSMGVWLLSFFIFIHTFSKIYYPNLRKFYYKNEVISKK